VSDELRDEITIWLPTHIPEIPAYKAHQVAEVLMPLIRGALAEAWDQGYIACPCDYAFEPAVNPYREAQ
jgi:ferredoxin-thioredoxin reductase catalytic subunit